MADQPVTIAETSVFRRVVENCLTEDELEAFKYFLARNPEAGPVIRGTGGVRKIRWGIGGTGKSGGVRVIYYYMSSAHPIFLLTIYRKAVQVSLTDAQKEAMRQLVAMIKEEAS